MISNNRFADTGAIGAAIAFDPTQPVMNGNSKYGGYFAWENAGEFISIATKNPVAMLQQKKEEANSKTWSVISKLIINSISFPNYVRT